MAYYRKGDKTLLVIGNYQTQEQTIALPAPYKSVLLNNYNDVVLNGNEVTLHGYQALLIFRILILVKNASPCVRISLFTHSSNRKCFL